VASPGTSLDDEAMTRVSKTWASVTSLPSLIDVDHSTLTCRAGRAKYPSVECRRGGTKAASACPILAGPTFGQ
jgi:hypothetical protein